MLPMHAVFFYARKPDETLQGKTRLGAEIGNQKLANQLARALITDMRHEYLPKEHDAYAFFDIQDFPNVDFDHVGTAEKQVFSSLLKAHQKVLIVGSDLPHITESILHKAFSTLEGYDAVIVPTEDLGYGLVGMNTFVDLFSDINNWESRSKNYNLVQETRRLAQQTNTQLFELEKVYDIDTVTDVQRLWQDMQKETLVHMKETADLLSAHKDVFHLT